MKTMTKTESKKSKSKFNDEFENYLRKQCLKTTFNGIELETFSWYKKSFRTCIKKRLLKASFFCSVIYDKFFIWIVLVRVCQFVL